MSFITYKIGKKKIMFPIALCCFLFVWTVSIPLTFVSFYVYPWHTILFYALYYSFEPFLLHVFRYVIPFRSWYMRQVLYESKSYFSKLPNSKPFPKRTVCAQHGHGMLAMSAMTEWYQQLLLAGDEDENLVWLVGTPLFYFPLVSFCIRLMNCDALTKENVNKYMKRDATIVMFPYGFKEMERTEYGKEKAYIEEGIFHLIKKHSYDLMFSYHKGENRTFHLIHFPKVISSWLVRNSIPGIMFYGRYGLPFLPFQSRLETIHQEQPMKSDNYETPREFMIAYCNDLRKHVDDIIVDHK